MYTIRKKFRFESSHILDDSYSKDCQNIHGHSYILEIFISTKELNADGMVVDFGELKTHIQPLVDSMDHAFIMSEDYLDTFDTTCNKVYVMDSNPTAENMCEMLYQLIIPYISGIHNVKLKVRLHETETGYAEYTEE